ncbi:pilus assembly protein PilM [bacterium]|nr:pilus assembly protein PilM [bacterium]
MTLGKHQPILVLDIGTRKVAGVVVKPKDKGLKVLAARVFEHPDRAMLDGQVHKVEAVAKVVARVKAELEAELGITLHEASVAAAGRALLTESAEQKRKLPHTTEITRADVLALELAAARTAQTSLQVHGTKNNLHCVGFSVVKFSLDGEVLDDLVGHQGREISVEVLATFLPRQVVDALMAVLRRAGLSARSLTLEPIAAIEATIPPDLRRMNLALVDVGAGTSDIAITRDGSVFAYAMVTQAGDEITEKLCERYLLEFQEAEQVKRCLQAADGKPICFKNILNQDLQFSAEEIIETLLPAIKRLAESIASIIIKLNGTAPRAVIMVGGGSATPQLGEQVAQTLEIEENRVGSRGPETIIGLENPTTALHGIEAITPLGIGLLAVQDKGLRFMTAQVNDQPVQLLALTSQPTVFDALLSSGREMKSLHARPGAAITYTLAGQFMSAPGSLGQPAKLFIQDEPVGLDTGIQEGTIIKMAEAIDGEDVILNSEMIPRPSGPFWCTVNGGTLELELQLADQGNLVAANTRIRDRAELDWQSHKPLIELVPELDTKKAKQEKTRFKLNGELHSMQKNNSIVIKVNGNDVQADYYPRPNDRIEWEQKNQPVFRLCDLGELLPQPSQITVRVNGKPRILDTGGGRIYLNGQPARYEDQVPDLAEIVIEKTDTEPPILSQALDGVDIVPPKNAGPIQLLVDGQKAAFTTPLRDGARVEISFGK